MSRLSSFGVFAATLVLLVLLLPERLYGDDVWFVRCIVEQQPFTGHFLYMPLARVFTWAGAHLGLDPFKSLRLLAAGGAALGAALLFSAALRRGARPLRALLFAWLPLGSASTLFFATAAEIHAVHFAAAGLLAWCLARLDPDGPSRRVFFLGLAFGVFVGTHQSGALMLPGILALALVATPERSSSARGKDVLAFAAAGAVSLLAMLGFTLLESGGFGALDDTTALLGPGMAGRLSNLGWRAMIDYLAEDAVSFAFPLTIAGLAALGGVTRVRPRLGLAILIGLLPYVLFFPVFHFFERGAYYIPCLPLLAGALLTDLSSTGPSPQPAAVARIAPRMALGAAGGLPLLIALLAAPWRPQELSERLPHPLLFCMAAAALGLGFLMARPVLTQRPALAAGALMLCLQGVGSLRELRAFDREEPLLDWTRAACETTGGREALVVTTGFSEYWMLVLLRCEWPEPWAGTWDFAEALPRPTPRPFLYGDPTVPRAQFESGLAELVAAGSEVLLDQRVVDFVAARPAAQRAELEVDLEHIRRHYRLQPLEHGPFRAQRVLPAP